ncbi:DUF895 domain membrane protein [Gaertneriomyces sp. JEL0708]|nr:DUF895 domain membrane protein [Gaertneriomyces sp. JEL0708]
MSRDGYATLQDDPFEEIATGQDDSDKTGLVRRPSTISHRHEPITKHTTTTDPMDVEEGRPTHPRLMISPEDIRKYTMMTTYLGGTFCILFTAFNVGQTFLTVLYPNVGTYTLGILYGFFAVGALIAPKVGERVGVKWGMAIGAAGIVLFVGILTTGIRVLVLLVAAVVGFGSGCLWINQGVWLSRLSSRASGGGSAPSSAGFFTGLFFTVCNLNGIFGNALAIVLLEMGLGIKTMIWGMFAVALIGFVMMLFADPMTKEKSANESGGERDRSLWDELRGVWKGCNLAFAFGRLPNLIPKAVDGSSGTQVAQVFLCYGILQCAFSFINGTIYDRWGAKPLLITLCTTGCTAYILLILIIPGIETLPLPLASSVLLYMLIGALLGHLDTTLNTTINLAMSSGYASLTPSAFGWYRVGFCIGIAGMSIGAAPWPNYAFMIWNLMWVCVCVGIYFWKIEVLMEPVDEEGMYRHMGAVDIPVGMNLNITPVAPMLGDRSVSLKELGSLKEIIFEDSQVEKTQRLD